MTQCPKCGGHKIHVYECEQCHYTTRMRVMENHS